MKDFERIDNLEKELAHLKMLFKKNLETMEEYHLHWKTILNHSDKLIKAIEINAVHTSNVLDTTREILAMNKRLNEKLTELLNVE